MAKPSQTQSGWGGLSASQTRASTSGGVGGPCWRKTKQQRVDEKINKLLTALSEHSKPAISLNDHQKRAELTAKYFPGKDVPLTQKEQKSENESPLDQH